MTLRVGIIGCGGISRSHAAAHANLEGIDLVAMCDINRDALNNRADEYGVSNRYTDYEEMFAREALGHRECVYTRAATRTDSDRRRESRYPCFYLRSRYLSI